MITIKLKENQTGYDVIEKYVQRYWDHNICTTVVVSLSLSYDDYIYEHINDVATPIGIDGVEFLYDWWEGQRYIRLYGIKAIDEIKISDGIYEL